jgi:predicted nucleic acid-binding protein
MPQTRIAFADANWLFALYYETRASEQVRSWAAAGPSTLVVSRVVVAECRCAFWRAGDRIQALESDLRANRLTDCRYGFEELLSASGEWFRRFAPRCNVGMLDLLHVRAAKLFGCPWFLSFDTASGCRAVAAAVGLKVFPELNDQDRDLLGRLRHR